MSNTCTKSKSLIALQVVDFITWVDQQSIGSAVTYDLTIRQGQSKSYNMKAYPDAGEKVRARGRGLNILSTQIYVIGTVNFN